MTTHPLDGEGHLGLVFYSGHGCVVHDDAELITLDVLCSDDRFFTREKYNEENCGYCDDDPQDYLAFYECRALSL